MRSTCSEFLLPTRSFSPKETANFATSLPQPSARQLRSVPKTGSLHKSSSMIRRTLVREGEGTSSPYGAEVRASLHHCQAELNLQNCTITCDGVNSDGISGKTSLASSETPSRAGTWRTGRDAQTREEELPAHQPIPSATTGSPPGAIPALANIVSPLRPG